MAMSDEGEVAHLADLEHLADAVVVDARLGAPFIEDPPGQLRVVPAHELERDLALQPDVDGEEHLAHPALAQEAHRPVPVPSGDGEGLLAGGRGRRWRGQDGGRAGLAGRLGRRRDLRRRGGRRGAGGRGQERGAVRGGVAAQAAPEAGHVVRGEPALRLQQVQRSALEPDGLLPEHNGALVGEHALGQGRP